MLEAEQQETTSELSEDEIKEQRKEEMRKVIIEQHNDYHIITSQEDLDNVKLKKLNTWTIDGDGVYLTVKNKIGEFTVKVADSDIRGLPSLQRNQYKMSVPKIPSKIYYQIQSFFVDIADKMNNAEAFVQVFYDNEEKEYICRVPIQRVAGASVRYDAESTLSVQDPDRYIFALEIHSHNTMDAFFSGVDDADEKECRFYGVFGRINDPVPKFVLRFVVNDSKPAVKPEQVFDFTERDEYPAEWKENVKGLGESTGVTHLDETETTRIVRPNESSWPNNNYYYGGNTYQGYHGQDPSEWDYEDDRSWPQDSTTKKVWDGEGTPKHVDAFMEEWKLQNQPEEVEEDVEETEEEDIRPPTLKGQDTEEESDDVIDPEELRELQVQRDTERFGPAPVPYDGPEKDWRDCSLPSSDVPTCGSTWDQEDYEMSTNNMKDAVEELETSHNLEDRWRSIEDFCCSLHDFDLDILAEHLEAYGYGDKMVTKLKAA